MIDTSIYARLAASSTIAASTAGRIYQTDPVQATARPFVVYRVTASAPVANLGGTNAFTTYAVDLDIWADTLAEADAIAQAAQGQLHCYRGGQIITSLMNDQSSEEFADAEEGELYHVRQSYTVIAASATVISAGLTGCTFLLDTATVETSLTNSLIAPVSGTIGAAFAYARTAPTGAALVFDINTNGSTIWASPDRLTIAAGQHASVTTSFNNPTVTAGDVLTIDVDQIGSGAPGSTITVELLIR